MLKEYIINILREEKTIKQISLLRTQFSPLMTDFYFFRTFFEVLIPFRITAKIGISIKPFTNLDYTEKPKELKSIEFECKGDYYKTEYDYLKLNDKLKEYNETQGNMSMMESANALVDIFIWLME